jgi:hypothetical protein
MRWAVHLARTGEMKNATKFLGLMDKKYFGNASLNGTKIFKMDLEKKMNKKHFGNAGLNGTNIFKIDLEKK